MSQDRDDSVNDRSDSAEEDRLESVRSRLRSRQRMLRRVMFADEPSNEEDDDEDNENDSSSSIIDDNSEESSVLNERNDLVNVLQYLIRSGVVHILPQADEDSDDYYVRPRVPNYGSKYKPNTEVIDKSEIKLITEQSSGVLPSKTGTKRGADLMSMIAKRQCGGRGFSHGERCRINNMFLPNKITHYNIQKYSGKVFTGTFSRSGDRLLTGAQDKIMRLYDTSHSDYKLINKINGLDVGWSIIDTAFNPTGDMIAYSSWSENIHVWNDRGDSDQQDTLPLCSDGGRFCIFSLTFSHDSSEILGGANDGCLYVYDLDYKKCALKMKGHGDDVNTVCFADESSNILYSGGDDGFCKVWDRRTLNETSPSPVGVLAGHKDGITFIDPRGDSRHLISNSKDQSIKLWDVRRFSSKAALKETCHTVSSQDWDYRRENVPKSMLNKTQLEGDTSVMTYRGHTVLQTLIRCRFSPAFSTGQRYIYTGCAAGRVVLYDVLTGEIESVLSGHKACVRDVSWHPYRGELVSVSWDRSVLKWCQSGGASQKEEETPSRRGSLAERKAEAAGLRRSARIAAQRAGEDTAA